MAARTGESGRDRSRDRDQPSERIRGGGHGARYEATHERIAAAALDLFGRLGFRGTSTREIARAAGVTEVTLFRHYPTKERLFTDVARRFSLLPVLERADELFAGMPLEAKLVAIGGRALALLRERTPLIRVMLGESGRHPREARLFFESVPGRGIELIAGLVETGIRAGRFRRVDPRLAARAFMGMLFTHNLLQEAFGGAAVDPVDPAAAVRAFVDIFLAGVRKEPSDA